MPPVWIDRLARVRKTLDSNFGDEMRALPRAVSQYNGAVADATRAEFDFIALLKIGEGNSPNLQGGIRSTWKARLPAGSAEMRVDVTVYPLAETLKDGDHVRANNRDEAVFEINRIDRSQRNRLVFMLTRL